MNPLKIIKNGIIDENPTFSQVIGMCPTLAVTTSFMNGLGMGLSTTAVLASSSIFALTTNANSYLFMLLHLLMVYWPPNWSEARNIKIYHRVRYYHTEFYFASNFFRISHFFRRYFAK